MQSKQEKENRRYNQQLTKLAARKEGLQSPLTLETMSKYSRIKRKGSTRLLLTMGDKNNNLIFHCIEKDKISYEQPHLLLQVSASFSVKQVALHVLQSDPSDTDCQQFNYLS